MLKVSVGEECRGEVLGMLEKGSCREVLKGNFLISVVEECWRRVLERSHVDKCWRRVLHRSVGEKCGRRVV